MKAIEATWELENLGVRTMEFTLTSEDVVASATGMGTSNTTSAILAEIAQLEQQYNVVKLDSSLAAMLLPLYQAGYGFIESQFIFLAQFADISLNSIQQRLVDSVSVRRLDISDTEGTARLFAEVQRGMFDTDRITLDPHFTPEQASRRYVNWIRNAMNLDSTVYEYLYKEQPIGFSIIKDMGDGTMDPFLGGTYTDFKKSGLGLNAFVKDLEIIAASGAKATPVAVSSNNPAVWKLYLQLGYRLQQVQQVLVKHRPL